MCLDLRLAVWQQHLRRASAAADDSLLWTVTGADGLSIQSKRGGGEKKNTRIELHTNKQTNKPLSDQSITGLWILSLSSKMHERKTERLRFPAVWELYLERESACRGQMFYSLSDWWVEYCGSGYLERHFSFFLFFFFLRLYSVRRSRNGGAVEQ